MTEPRRVMSAFCAEPWAIAPGALQQLAMILQRHGDRGDLRAELPGYVQRDYQIIAGPTAQKLPGSFRSQMVDGVAIVPVFGPIFPRANMMTEMSGATSISVLQNDYRAALDNPDIGAIMLLLDSPGGQVSGTAAFADQVASGSKKKQTVSYVSGSAASGAYWIASAASEIVTDRTSVLGSIGVVVAHPKQVLPDANGDLWVEIVSSNAPMKRPDPMSEDGFAEIRGTLDAMEKQFIADIARNRGVTVEKVRNDFGQGGVKVGSEARDAGMADRVASYDATINAMRREVSNRRRLQDAAR